MVERVYSEEEKKEIEEQQRVEEEKKAAAKGDNKRERALQDMMGGVLEVKKEDILKQVTWTRTQSMMLLQYSLMPSRSWLLNGSFTCTLKVSPSSPSGIFFAIPEKITIWLVWQFWKERNKILKKASMSIFPKCRNKIQRYKYLGLDKNANRR